jgi:hypothetical protein
LQHIPDIVFFIILVESAHHRQWWPPSAIRRFTHGTNRNVRKMIHKRFRAKLVRGTLSLLRWWGRHLFILCQSYSIAARISVSKWRSFANSGWLPKDGNMMTV